MDTSFVHLHDAGRLTAGTERLLKGTYTLSFCHLTAYEQSHPDHWEHHPAGDELVFLIDGKMQA